MKTKLIEKQPNERMFPVLGRANQIPWRLVEPLRESCMKAHNQTLERLAERGGLGVYELYIHIHKISWEKACLFETKLKPEASSWFETWVNS